MSDFDYTPHLLEVARMMELAARTAPKTKGEDFVLTKTISGEEIPRLAEAMLVFGKGGRLPANAVKGPEAIWSCLKSLQGK